MGKLRVFLADDHSIVREGLKALINQQPDMEVVGEAEDGRTAVAAASSTGPDIVLLDISMPHVSGLEAMPLLAANCPGVPIMALSIYDEAAYVHRLLELGAAGYVLKSSAADDLITAVRSVAAGGIYIDPRVAGTFVARAVGTTARPRGAPRATLSEREARVLRMIAQGYSNKEIGASLTISIKTVETYKARAMVKLGLKSRIDIVKFAVDQGWLSAVSGGADQTHRPSPRL